MRLPRYGVKNSFEFVEIVAVVGCEITPLWGQKQLASSVSAFASCCEITPLWGEKQRNIERYRIFGFGLWAVCLKETGEMIGDYGLTMQLVNGQIKPEIGYRIRADQQRKGYAREAASAVRDWTFINTPFNIVYSYMKYTNEASARTAMSYGCRQVDEFEDDVNGITKVFAVSREDAAKFVPEK